MKIDLLGPLQVGEGIALEPRDRAALCVLAVRRNQIASSEQLAEALWPNGPPPSWAKQVQICVSRLRRALGPETIVTTSGGYRLNIDESDVDSDQFEQLITKGHAFSSQGEPDRAAVAYARALSLWRGRPFEDVDDWPQGEVEAARLTELRRTAQEDWLEARLAAGDHRLVAIEGVALAAEEPLRERRWELLALAQYRSGRQADSLRSLDVARRTLRDELGVDPGADLVALEGAILRQDQSLAAAPAPMPISKSCPYKGLARYDVDDGEQFFGREDEVTLGLERLRSSPVLVLAGPSGSGKSSVARAGLVPALKERGLSVEVFVPGRDPDRAMTEATLLSATGTVLVVDQLEEMFALDVPGEVVHEFCRRLAAYAVDSAPVILVIRSDFLGGLVVSPELSRLAEQGLRLVSPLTGEALRRAIEEPAIQAGLRLEHGLIELLFRDTEGEPGALPLLSHALAETWQRRDGNVLTVEGYRASGGIRGAVAHSADRLYDSLPVDQRSVLRSLLLRMVAPSIDGPPVRRRVSMRNVVGDPDRDRVVALLVRSRLVTAEEDSYELAHEALVRAWPRLKSWLDDDADGQRILRHLAARAEDWDALGRPDSELYRGARLQSALEWREAGEGDLNDLERAFLTASSEHAASESNQILAMAVRDARRNRTIRGLLVATAALLIVSLMGGSLAVSSRQDARLEVLVNQSLALRSTNRSAAALLAVEAYRRNPEAGPWSALLGTFTAVPGFLGYQFMPEGDHLTGALVPGTTNAVVALNSSDLRLVDLSTGTTQDVFTDVSPGAGWGSRIRVSDDGRYVAQYSAHISDRECFTLESLMASDDEGCAVLQVFEVSTGKPIMEPVIPAIGLGELAISADGALVAVTGGFDGDLAIYRTADGELVGSLDGVPRPEGVSVWRNAGVDFGADGLVYLGSMAGPVRAIDPLTMQVRRSFEAPRLSSNNFVITTSDTLYIAGTQALAAFDLSGGAPRWTVDLREGRHEEPCPWFEVNEGQGVLYCGDFYGVIELRSSSTGVRTGVTLDPQLGAVGDLETSTDGLELAVFGGGSPAISRWKFDGSGLVTNLVAEGLVAYDGYNVAGDSLFVALRNPLFVNWDEFNDFSVWDPAADVPKAKVPIPLGGAGWAGPDAISGFSSAEGRIVLLEAGSMGEVDVSGIPEFEKSINAENLYTSAGGEFIYFTFNGGEIWKVDTSTMKRIEPKTAISGSPRSASATRHGNRLVVSGWSDAPYIDVYDGATGEHLAGPQTGAFWSAVSLDGTVVGALGGQITEYDIDTLEPLGTFAGARGEVNTLQFSDDGRVLLAGANDQTVSIYDVASRRRIGDVISTFSPFIGPGFLRPDGKAVAVNQQGGVVIWDIDPAHLEKAACELAGRNLTETEWQTYLATFGPYRATCLEYG